MIDAENRPQKTGLNRYWHLLVSALVPKFSKLRAVDGMILHWHSEMNTTTTAGQKFRRTAE